jgi:hypothetical protein
VVLWFCSLAYVPFDRLMKRRVLNSNFFNKIISNFIVDCGNAHQVFNKSFGVFNFVIANKEYKLGISLDAGSGDEVGI